MFARLAFLYALSFLGYLAFRCIEALARRAYRPHRHVTQRVPVGMSSRRHATAANLLVAVGWIAILTGPVVFVAGNWLKDRVGPDLDHEWTNPRTSVTRLRAC